MPQVGEQRTVGGVTGAWNGQTWRKVQAAPEQPGALSRFLGGAMKTSPLNPMNLVRAVGDLPGTIGGLLKTGIVDPITEGVETSHSLYRAATNTPDQRTGGSRGSALVDAARHAEGMIPFFGKSLQGSSDKIAGGDVAGGLGEIAGTASSAALPKLASSAAELPGVVGRLAGRASQSPITRGLAAAAEEIPVVGKMGKAARAGYKAAKAVQTTPESIAEPFKANKSGYSPNGEFGGDIDPSVRGYQPPAAAPTGPVPRHVKGGTFQAPLEQELQGVIQGLRNQGPESVEAPPSQGITDMGTETAPMTARGTSDMRYTENPGTKYQSSGRPAVGPDFYSDVMKGLEQPADFDWPEAGGRYVRNEIGSTVRETPPPTINGAELPQAWQALPPPRDLYPSPDIADNFRRAEMADNASSAPGPTFDSRSPNRAVLDEQSPQFKIAQALKGLAAAK